MGIENVGAFSSGDTPTESDPDVVRPTDEEVKARQESELAAEREEHNRRRLAE